MSYLLKIIPKAQKDLDGIKGKDFAAIKEKIISLSANPRPFGSIKLTIEEGYRIRAGDYRVLYIIDDTTKVVFIYRIKRRNHAYQ